MKEWKAEVEWKLLVLCEGSYVCESGELRVIEETTCSTISGVRRSNQD